MTFKIVTATACAGLVALQTGLAQAGSGESHQTVRAQKVVNMMDPTLTREQRDSKSAHIDPVLMVRERKAWEDPDANPDYLVRLQKYRERLLFLNAAIRNNLSPEEQYLASFGFTYEALMSAEPEDR